MFADFADVHRNYGRLVEGIVQDRCRNGRMETDDIRQEIWMEVWRQWPAILASEYQPGGIIRRLAHQVATRQWRVSSATKRGGQAEFVDHEQSEPLEWPAQEATIMLRQVSAAVNVLPEAQRQALVESSLGAMLRDQADPQGISPQAVQHRIKAARRKLQKMGH